MQNAPGRALHLPGLTLRPIPPENETAKFDLVLNVWETGRGLAAQLRYNSDLFDAATAERLLRHFDNLLRAVVAAPESRLSELTLLDADERAELLVRTNETRADYPRNECIHQLFEAQAARTPDNVAVTFEGVTLTYSELNERANRLAHYLRSHGVGAESRVGLLLERSAEVVAALMGVLKAGGVYVPLDPEYPHERLAFMLEDAGVCVL